MPLPRFYSVTESCCSKWRFAYKMAEFRYLTYQISAAAVHRCLKHLHMPVDWTLLIYELAAWRLPGRRRHGHDGIPRWNSSTARGGFPLLLHGHKKETRGRMKLSEGCRGRRRKINEKTCDEWGKRVSIYTSPHCVS